MKNIYLLFTILSTIIFTACGGGGSSGTGAIGKNDTVSAYLIDSAITGVKYEYEADQESHWGLTDVDGMFTAVGSTDISFSVGGIHLGSIKLNEYNKRVTPSDLYGLEYSNFTDVRVLNFIQLMQSIDNDLDPSNGIVISIATLATLNDLSLNLSSPSTTSEDLEAALKGVGISLVPEDIALKHYKATLLSVFGLNFGANLDSEDPVITSPSSVSVDENQTYVLTVTATDDLVVYFSISGTDSDSLSINTNSGELVFNESPDYETKSSYSVIITAYDSLFNSSTQTLNISINDLTENSSYLNEPYFSQQWALEKNDDFYNTYNIDDSAHINPGTTYENYTGNGINIAIIDNGFDVSHEDLASGIIDTYDLVSGTSNVEHDEDDEYHGTAVSGIAAARLNYLGVKGVAHNANLILIKYNSSGMSDSEFIQLFDKAEELDADIINCSWGTGDVSDIVKDKIQDLATNGRGGKGISIVFSSGNDNDDMNNDEANIDEVISVGATNKYNIRTTYSNYGTNLDLVAPGGDYLGIATTDVSGTDGGSSFDDNYLQIYDYFIGTSASAPIVSGIIALMLEKDPTLTRVEIENILRNSSDKIGEEIYSSGRNDYYGYGKVNLSEAMSNIN